MVCLVRVRDRVRVNIFLLFSALSLHKSQILPDRTFNYHYNHVLSTILESFLKHKLDSCKTAALNSKAALIKPEEQRLNVAVLVNVLRCF